MSNVTPFIPRNNRFRIQRLLRGDETVYFIIDPAVGIFPAGQSFIREISAWQNRDPKTVRSAAYIIVDWCNYLREKKVNWHEATDQHYLEWLSAQKVTKKRLGRKNAVVWRWYRYLFQHDAYRSSAAATFAQISLPTNESEFGRPRYSPKHGHKDDRDLQKERKSKTFLSDDTVDTLLEKIADLGDSFLVDRDSLIGAYEAGCGLRAIGISHIRLSALSSALARRGVIPKHACILRYAKDREAQAYIRTKVDQISELGGHGIFINLVEKASKTRDVLIETALIHQTLDFVWKYHKNWINKIAPRETQHGHLFLSLKTGQGLLPATVSDIMKRYFNRFGLDGSGHDLRRNKITRRALELVQKSKRRDNLFDGGAIEVAMADEFGHSDFKTMGPYVNMGRILDSIADEVEEHYER